MEAGGIFSGLKIPPILAGVVVDTLATYVAMYAWIVIFVSRQLSGQGEVTEEAIRNFLASPEGLQIGMAIGTLCTVLGGYVAGRRAGVLRIKHGAFVGVGSLVVAALEQAIAGGGVSAPQWYLVVSAVAPVPAGALGGYIAERLGSSGPNRGGSGTSRR
jgi:hypothetical protein